MTSEDRRAAKWDTSFMEKYSSGLFDATVGAAHLITSRPDPDRIALDRLVTIAGTEIGVQLKASYTDIRHFDNGGLLRYPVTEKWVKIWHERRIAPRLVLYLIDRDPCTTIQRRMMGEWHRACGYWAVLDENVSAPSVIIDKRNRFTVDTLYSWEREIGPQMGGIPR